MEINQAHLSLVALMRPTTPEFRRFSKLAWPANYLHRPLISLITALAVLLSPSLMAHTSLISNIEGYSVTAGKLSRFNAILFTNDKIDALYGHDFPAAPNSFDHLLYEHHHQDDFSHSSRIDNSEIKHIDGKGLSLLPGLIDAHGHVLGYGLSLLQAQLRDSQSEQDAITKVQAFRKAHPQLTWIQGRGWNQVLWPSNAFPSKNALDIAFPTTPVWLVRIDGHAGWANSAAMKLAKIDSKTQAPTGGEIIRDAQGQPTGVFIDNAMGLISSNIPPLSLNEQKAVLLTSLQQLAKLGLTSVHDAGISSTTIKAYKQLDQAKRLPIRVYAMIDATDEHYRDLIKAGPTLSDLGHSDMLAINSVKISSDGALGSRGAALISDYSDKAGHKGLLLYPEAKLSQTIEAAMAAGFQVNTHAIGDEANKQVLDNYQRLIKKTDTKALRHRIEHAQVLQLADIPRFAALGVIASMQATHATSDKNMAEDRLGPQRIKGAYAWQKLIQSGAVIAAGSDFPIESANPFYGLHASVTRQDQHNQPTDGWYNIERMSITQALESFTYSAAFAAHQEQSIGSLAPGMKADFILTDKNIFTSAPELIWQTQVQQTWVNGRRQYQAPTTTTDTDGTVPTHLFN
nr:amidohydrolase [Shewanella sp. SR44-3]